MIGGNANYNNESPNRLQKLMYLSTLSVDEDVGRY